MLAAYFACDAPAALGAQHPVRERDSLGSICRGLATLGSQTGRPGPFLVVLTLPRTRRVSANVPWTRLALPFTWITS
jgi:hypothetical protein